jgi:hypothetical protein
MSEEREAAVMSADEGGGGWSQPHESKTSVIKYSLFHEVMFPSEEIHKRKLTKNT